MLSVLIYIVEAVRHSLRKAVRGVSVVVETYHEAQEFRRNAARHYIEE